MPTKLTKKPLSMPSILSVQPFKAIYIVLGIIWFLTRLPFWIISYSVLPATRPYSEWTFTQAVGARFFKWSLGVLTTIRYKSTLSLEPGAEGKRFTVIDPLQPTASNYAQPLLDDSEIQPEPVGATWYPEPLQPVLSPEESRDLDVVLHLHGGAYVFGNARDAEVGSISKQMHAVGEATHVLMVAYRVSCYETGRFPAPLQDAVTAYLYLVRTLKIPASRITISGDSAGGNLALALLRYIGESGQQQQSSSATAATAAALPWPGCAWIWSPWPDVSACLDMQYLPRLRNYATDYVPASFAYWGATTIGGRSRTYGPSGPYLNPKGHPFHCKTPIFVQAGGTEVLYDDIKALAKKLELAGTTVSFLGQPTCPHDILGGNVMLGFASEAIEAVRLAGHFLQKNRFLGHHVKQ